MRSAGRKPAPLAAQGKHVSAIFLLLAASAAGQTTGADQTGGISGVVVDAVTRLPVKKTVVSINPMGNFGHPQGPQAVTTDAGGTFTVSNLQAGKYQLVFMQQSYPQARFGGMTKSVDVKAGETSGPVTVELMPGAAVSGHVTDEDGDPLANCNVQIHPAKNPDQGVPMLGISQSNEDGEYRAFGVMPGKYILSAQCGMDAFQARPFSAGPDAPPAKAYPPQYYPLARDSKAAQVLELTAGVEKPGIDFQMIPTPVTQIRGRFSPGGADWHGSNPLVLQLNPVAEHSMNLGMNLGASPDLAKGTFEFQRVFPGSYILFAFSNGGEENRVGAWQRVEVSDKPVDVVLELRHAIEISGKVDIEKGGNSTTPVVTANQINIQLLPQNQQLGMPGSQAQVNADGTFTLKGVMPAPWRLQVNGPWSFLKSAWLGSSDVTHAPMDLSGGAAGGLRILVSMNTATIRGSAPAGQMIYAQRVEEDAPFRASHGSQVDQNGQYKFEGLAPGKYRLMVGDSLGAMPEEGGQEITVREGETAMLDLKPQAAAR
jgi:protocatechuate 3,4-dioxygenase beta subunit